MKKILIKDMAGVKAGSPINVKDKKVLAELIERGYLAKEEKRGRKTKEEKAQADTK